MKRALLERSHAVMITFVCAALVITGCSAPRPVGSSALNLAPSGRVIVNGEEVSALPHQDGVARLTSVLGAPDLNGPLSNVCDNPALGEWSIVGWKNFSVLIQIGDNPYGGGNDRKGRIVGWELTSWTDQRLDPSPSMNGLTLGSTLASARAAIPNAVDGEGDGVWGLYVDRGPDILSGAHLYFLSNSPEAQVIYIGSGLTCS